MSRPPRARLGVERLETRETPAISASVTRFGDLVVFADSASDIAITQTAQGSYTVSDGATPVGTFTGVTRDLQVIGSVGSDSVSIDLGGFSARNLFVDLGEGDNGLGVFNGRAVNVSVNGGLRSSFSFRNLGGAGSDEVTFTALDVSGSVGIAAGDGANNISLTDGLVSGSVVIVTGAGTDTVTLGDGVTEFTAGSTFVVDGGDPGDALVVNGLTTLRNLWTSAFNDVTLAAGSTVRGFVSVAGGFNSANSLTLAGRVGGSVSYGGSGGADTLTLEAGASIGRRLGAALFDGDDVVRLDGEVSGRTAIDAGSGDDRVDINGPVLGDTTLRLGSGNDQFHLAGRVGTAQGTRTRLTVDAGNGDDVVILMAGSSVNGRARINLGRGDDSAAVDDGAAFVAAAIDGGTDTDTFNGTSSRAGLTLRRFEVFG